MTFTNVTSIIVYETNDYDKFILLEENRKITVNRELERVILKRNKLKYNPIIVSPDMEVIDGQHRLQIAKEHELIIYYIIDADPEVNDVHLLNVGNKNWSQEDHLHFFVKQGNVTYIFIDRMIKEYQVSLSCFNSTFTGGDFRKVSRDFKSGTITLKYTFPTIELFCGYFKDIQEAFRYYSNKKYMTKALQWSIMTTIARIDYDHEHMMRKINMHPDELIRANSYNNVENARNVLINDLYNRKMSVGNRMALEPQNV